MTDWRPSPPETAPNGPCLVGWSTGEWAVGEQIVVSLHRADLAWVQQGTSRPFNPQPQFFASVEGPKT